MAGRAGFLNRVLFSGHSWKGGEFSLLASLRERRSCLYEPCIWLSTACVTPCLVLTLYVSIVGLYWSFCMYTRQNKRIGAFARESDPAIASEDPTLVAFTMLTLLNNDVHYSLAGPI